MNFILDTDSYKLSHFLGYPKGTEYIYSYAESRGGEYEASMFLGQQRYLKQLANVRVSRGDVSEARDFAHEHGEPFNEQWTDLVDQPIPLEIKSVPEGSLIPVKNVLSTVENTRKGFGWLTSAIETPLLRATWYPTTVATRIHYMKKKIKPYYDRTSDTGDMGFALLDFSARGCSSLETAKIGGLGHLVHFSGSDNIPAVMDARRYYDCHMAAYSVPATEHSIMTSFGKAHELESFEYLIDNMMQPNGILSVVTDTWDVFTAAEKFGTLVEKIRAKNGTLVFRPDSGEFKNVILRVLMTLEVAFGSTLNSKGYKVLNNVKMLWGDGINENTCDTPFQIAEEMGISADSIMVGSGGGLMQSNIDRDTLKFAYKASNVTINGVDHEISKDPITGHGKKSKAGRFALVNAGEGIETIRYDSFKGMYENILRTTYRNGELFNVESLDQIRERAAMYCV